MEKKRLRPHEVEMEYGLNYQSLAHMRVKKIGPRYEKVGRKILYRPQDIEEFLKRHAVKVNTAA